MSFEAKEKAVDKLLNDAIYYIPRNQRRYVWNAQNWADMYDDVLLESDLSRVFSPKLSSEQTKKQKGLLFTAITSPLAVKKGRIMRPFLIY